MPEDETLCQFFVTARNDLGLSLGKMARLLGVTAPFIQKVEKGNCPVPKKRIEDFARAYGVSIEQIVALNKKRKVTRKRNLEIILTKAKESKILRGNILPLLERIVDGCRQAGIRTYGLSDMVDLAVSLTPD